MGFIRKKKTTDFKNYGVFAQKRPKNDQNYGANSVVSP